VILVHYRDGSTKKIDPKVESVDQLDSPSEQKNIRRLAILDGEGKRIDLPPFKNGVSRVWIELLHDGTENRGERVCVRKGRDVLKVTMYYSDGRFVLDY
jgi:hypothetical protein